MSGRKHRLQQLAVQHPDFSKVDDPFERDLLFRGMQATPYCKHCGGEILAGDKDSKHQGELAAMAHTDCELAFQEKERQRLAKERREAEEARRNFNMDDYMEKMLKERGKHEWS